jgi:selenium-binding protein 1
VWLWHKNGDQWSVDEVIAIPAEPADPDDLPPLFKPFGAAPPLVTDIDLSVDDRWLHVSCWGTEELNQYDVGDPFRPRETASVRIDGIVRREPHPAASDLAACRWTADGGDRPRRSPGVRHELAVRGVGRRGLL